MAVGVRAAAPIIVGALLVACSASDDGSPGNGGAGAGGAPSLDPLPVAVVVQTRGDQVRLIARTGPLSCETADAGVAAVDRCGDASAEVFLPREKLEVGPVFITDDVRVQTVVTLGSPEDTTCFRDVSVGNPNQKVVFEEISEAEVVVRLTGFAVDLDGDGAPEALLEGSYAGPRCDLNQSPLELAAGAFVVVRGHPSILIGSSDGATCETPEMWSEDCDSWRLEIQLPEIFEPDAILGPYQVGSTFEMRTIDGLGFDDCGGGLGQSRQDITFEAVSESEVRFALPHVDTGTSTPIGGRYVAPICW